MAFSTNCPHKGCHKAMEPYLDPKTDKVYCSACDQELTNLTYFAKAQMKSSKQFKPKKNLSFATTCIACKKEDRPIILNDKICCPACKKEHSHLSEPYKLMLKENLKKVGQDI